MNRYLAENITNEDILNLPLRAFEGEIIVVESEENCSKAVAELQKLSEIGFDTETKPAFNKGEFHDTALIQLSTMDKAYLFRLNKIGYPKQLFDLLEDPAIVKLGISIYDDLRGLKKVRDYEPAGFIDLNDLAKELGVNHMGVKKLAAIFMEFRISKNQQTSNWENETLTDAQQRYAATDAWICLTIYQKIRDLGYL